MPDKPAGGLNVGVVSNKAQQRTWDGLADSAMDEEDLGGGAGRSAGASAPTQLAEKQRQFYSLFQGVSGSDSGGGRAFVPDGVALDAVHGAGGADALPRVGDSPEELAARAEDLERRAARIAGQGDDAGRPPISEERQHFVHIMDGVRQVR
jgi:hypothetical protein